MDPATGKAAGAGSSGVRLAELVGTLSLAVDLGLGQPMEHVARSCLLASRLGERMGLDDAERASLYYVSLLGWLGCIADSHDASVYFGDDIEYRAGVYDVDMKPLPFLGYLLRHAGTGSSPTRRLGVRAGLVATGARKVQDSLRVHCQVTRAIAERLGLDDAVCVPLLHIFARWDGKGLPSDIAGDQIARPIRLWHVTDVAEVHHRRGGVDAAVEVARRRSGSQFDPAVVDAFCAEADALFAGLPEDSTWDALVDAEPALQVPLTEERFDVALGVFADFADLKVPALRGHSRGVAELAADAGRRLGMTPGEVRTLRNAALVHDLGRTGVPNTILEKTGPLTTAEQERLRLHSYYTERMLARPQRLRELGSIAALAHERLDGSGYHRGLTAPVIPRSARVLAAADSYQAMLEPRAGAAAHQAGEAAQALQDEVRAGRLDAEAVDAVLAAAGQGAMRRVSGPAGLTPRETQVLELVARGLSNRQIARRLDITPKTAGNHIERIYAKAGVSTRAAATLFAMQHGLLSSPISTS